MKKILLGLLCLTSIILSKEVTVSILPQEYFVKKIVGDKINVNVMVKPGSSPATYEPKVSQMRKLTDSEIYFAIGVPFEKVWLDKFKNANKNMLVVNTSKGIKKLKMKAHSHHEKQKHGHYEHDEKHHEHAHHEDQEEHQHHKHHEHKHTGLDPHIWLDPELVKIQAKNILNAVLKIDQKNALFYKANYGKFLKELDSLDKKIEALLKPYHDKAFMVFHPSWGYFAKRYDLEQISIEIQGKEPKPAQLIKLVKEAKEHNIKIVFVAPQFSQKGAKTISKSINGNVAVINPLSVKWDENLIKVAKEIAKSYK